MQERTTSIIIRTIERHSAESFKLTVDVSTNGRAGSPVFSFNFINHLTREESNILNEFLEKVAERIRGELRNSL